MIIYKNEDLFKAKEDILIHGCNCFHSMGAGVAKLVKKYYPEAYEVDLKTKYGDRNKLGSFSLIKSNHYFYPNQDIIVCNVYTQYNYGSYGNDLFEYQAFEKFLNEFKNYKMFDKSISMSKIGSGLCHGDWDVISEMIETNWKGKDVNVYYL